jgi:hypothetical protein
MDKQQQHMLGLDPEPQVKIGARIWFGQKLALWRSKYAWDLTVRQAAEIVSRCRHVDGCPALTSETESCLPDCQDREIRLSALVVLNAARQFAPPIARKISNQPYSAPSREYFSDVVAELAAAQAELEVLRGTVVTAPPPNEPQLQEKRK